jgi:hypothetical protein
MTQPLPKRFPLNKLATAQGLSETQIEASPAASFETLSIQPHSSEQAVGAQSDARQSPAASLISFAAERFNLFHNDSQTVFCQDRNSGEVVALERPTVSRPHISQLLSSEWLGTLTSLGRFKSPRQSLYLAQLELRKLR